ncbi:MAG: nucleotidyltransferase domain-containing protein [Emcibacteraceae bacterium]|nr:nucleotidyltransferase domain-containing protein [Emcibacteraceae bacterium]
MQYGLGKNIIRQIHNTFSKFPQIEEVFLYGSRAKGTFKTGSDIDLTLKGEGLNLKLINKISLVLDELYIPYEFDLSIYDHIENSDLLDHIKSVGIEFYRKK